MSSGSRNSHHRHFRVYCQDGMQEESSSCFSSLPYFFEGHGPFQEPSFVEDPLYDTIYETKWKLLNMEAARIQRETSGAWKPLSSIANRECSQEPLILRSRHKNFSTSSLLNSTSARRIVVRRSGSGFGFTLRHFIVYPPEDDPGEPPPGGGSDNSAPKPLDTIFVKSVRENSTAAEAGLRIGDRILSVNDTSIEGKSFGDVVKLVQDSPEYLYFVVCPQKDDVLQMYYSEIAQNPESNTRVESEVVRWSRESSPFSRNYEHVYAVPARITSTESINAKEEFLRFTPVCLQTRNPSSQDVPKRNPALDELPDTPLIKNNLKSVSTDLHSQEASKISDSDQQNNSRHKTYQDFDSYGQSIGHRRSNTNFVYRNEHTGHREQPSSAVFLEQDQSDTLILESSSSNNNNGSSSSVPSTTALLLRNQSTSTNDDAACSQTISAFSSSTVDCMEDPCRFSKPQQQLRRPNTLKLTTTTSIASNHSKQINPRDDDDRYIRRVSYLKATKEVETDSDEEVKNITAEVGQKPSHSIQRLRALFGEKVSNCPSSSPTLLVPSLQSSTSEIRTPSEVHTPTTLSSDGVKEGWLTCKISYICGKKATDRSWKTVYVVLKSHAMYMYKDKKTALESPMSCEEAPLSLNESTVEIAEDYTKRKNVFRIRTETGSVYLFQADGESVMKEWVRAVEETSMSIVIDERKDSSKPSSGFRKLTTSFRNKSPTGFPMPRKPSQDTTTPLSSSNGTLNVGSASSGTSVGSNKSTSTWRGKVVQKWKKIQHGSPSMNGSFGAQATSYPEGGSIGVPLDECPLSQEDNVPLLVKACCSIVEDKGLEIIGVYRVPGNKAAVTQLTEQINSINGEEVILAMEDPRWGDINVVSSLLKLFFRRLPDPLFTLDMYSSFIETSKIEEPIERINRLKKLIRELPEIHYETLKYVSKHLTKVIENSETNKMESRNLAIVFGPTLVRTSDEDMVTVVTDMSHQCRIIESILSNWEWFFNNDEIDCNYENIHFEEPVISDCNSLTTTSKGNETLLINNINKLEYSPGTLKSPVTAKDIVSGIISAANRKMMKSQNRKKETTPTTSQPLPLTTTITRMTGSVNSGISNTSSSTRDSDGGTITIVTASENEVEIPSSRREPIKASPFPFDTYQGLNEATAERIKRFEEETKAMMSLSQQQRITIKTTANSNNDTTHHFVTLTSTAPSSGVKSDAPDNNNAISVYSRTASNTSLAAPSHHDLEGGILLEEPYDTPKGTYDRLPGDCGGGPQDRFLTMTYLSSPTPPEILVRSNKSSSPTLTEYSSSSSNSSSFDTFKIASHGTLKRRILQKSVTENSLRPPFLSAGRRYHSSSNFSQLSSQSNNINEEITEENSVIKDPTLELMSSITANFDEKMRLLLDPHYQLSSSSDTQSVSSTPTKSKFRKKSEVCCDTSSVSASSEMNIIDSTTHKKRTSPKGTGVFSTVQKFESNNDKEHREAYNTEQRNRKSDLRRGRTVDKHKEPNGLRCLKRNDSLSKREKQELNLMKKQFSSSSSRVLKLKEQFEAQCLLQNNQKTVIGKESKLQKTIANNNQRRRVRRRHTVGGTKDFAHLEDFLSRDDQNDLGIEKKDDEEEKENNGRISPVVTEPKSQLRTFLRTHQRLNNSDLIEAEHRRLSLPDSVVLFGSHQSPYSFSCGTSVGSNV